jgi:Leucine-rich repeat (LRR) protein
MANLHTLDLRYNEIESIPNDVFLDLFNLEILSISGNYLKKLPNAFINLHNLRFIDSSDNEISAFDDDVFSTNNDLEEILLDNNQIKLIRANFEKFKNIGFIDFRGNVCIDNLYLKDHQDFPLLFEFQEEINYNCTKRITRNIKLLAGTVEEDEVMRWENCSDLKMSSLSKICSTARKIRI